MQNTISPNGDTSDSGSQPAGIPVGRVFAIRPGMINDDLRYAVEAVARVHGDGRLPTIPMFSVSHLVNAGGSACDGLFTFNVDTDDSVIPLSIVVRIGAPYREFVILHDVGHFLDANG